MKDFLQLKNKRALVDCSASIASDASAIPSTSQDLLYGDGSSAPAGPAPSYTFVAYSELSWPLWYEMYRKASRGCAYSCLVINSAKGRDTDRDSCMGTDLLGVLTPFLLGRTSFEASQQAPLARQSFFYCHSALGATAATATATEGLIGSMAPRVLPIRRQGDPSIRSKAYAYPDGFGGQYLSSDFLESGLATATDVAYKVAGDDYGGALHTEAATTPHSVSVKTNPYGSCFIPALGMLYSSDSLPLRCNMAGLVSDVQYQSIEDMSTILEAERLIAAVTAGYELFSLDMSLPSLSSSAFIASQSLIPEGVDGAADVEASRLVFATQCEQAYNWVRVCMHMESFPLGYGLYEKIRTPGYVCVDPATGTPLAEPAVELWNAVVSKSRASGRIASLTPRQARAATENFLIAFQCACIVREAVTSSPDRDASSPVNMSPSSIYKIGVDLASQAALFSAEMLAVPLKCMIAGATVFVSAWPAAANALYRFVSSSWLGGPSRTGSFLSGGGSDTGKKRTTNGSNADGNTETVERVCATLGSTSTRYPRDFIREVKSGVGVDPVTLCRRLAVAFPRKYRYQPWWKESTICGLFIPGAVLPASRAYSLLNPLQPCFPDVKAFKSHETHLPMGLTIAVDPVNRFSSSRGYGGMGWGGSWRGAFSENSDMKIALVLQDPNYVAPSGASVMEVYAPGVVPRNPDGDGVLAFGVSTFSVDGAMLQRINEDLKNQANKLGGSLSDEGRYCTPPFFPNILRS